MKKRVESFIWKKEWNPGFEPGIKSFAGSYYNH